MRRALKLVPLISDLESNTTKSNSIKHTILNTNRPILMPTVTSGSRDKGMKRPTLWVGQRVKGQGHTRPNIGLEACQRHHSRPPFFEQVFQSSAILFHAIEYKLASRSPRNLMSYHIVSCRFLTFVCRNYSLQLKQCNNVQVC